MSTNEVNGFVNALLRDGPFNPVETGHEKAANEVLARINATKANPDMDELDKEIEIEYDTAMLRSIMIAYVFGGEDPFSVPKAELQHALKYPYRTVFVSPDHRNRVKNANSAIRAKCIECQGNNQAQVRNCTSINCQLWPFRLGTNPFYGRLAGIDEDTEIVDSDAEIEALEAQRDPLTAAEKSSANS